MNDTKLLMTRIVLVETSVIHHPIYDRAFNSIENVFRMRNEFGLARHLFCVGQSGTGKSTIKKELLRKYPEVVSKDRTLIPIVCGNAPSKPTIRSMAEELLKELGEPLYHRGNTTLKTSRILQLLKILDVKVVILDELQHFLDHGNKRSANELADWLKTLIDNSDTSFVLIGLERAEKILQVNEQLRRRFSQRVTLPPFSVQSNEDVSVFAAVLRQIDKQLGLANTINITANLIERFHFATNGIMDYIVKLMIGAFEIALHNGSEGITEVALADAFERCIWSDCPDNLNPFKKSFKKRRLDKPGMPFFRITEPEDIRLNQ